MVRAFIINFWRMRSLAAFSFHHFATNLNKSVLNIAFKAQISGLSRIIEYFFKYFHRIRVGIPILHIAIVINRVSFEVSMENTWFFFCSSVHHYWACFSPFCKFYENNDEACNAHTAYIVCAFEKYFSYAIDRYPDASVLAWWKLIIWKSENVFAGFENMKLILFGIGNEQWKMWAQSHVLPMILCISQSLETTLKRASCYCFLPTRHLDIEAAKLFAFENGNFASLSTFFHIARIHVESLSSSTGTHSMHCLCPQDTTAFLSEYLRKIQS